MPAAWRITFSRDRSLPHCRSTWIMVVPTPRGFDFLSDLQSLFLPAD